MESKKMRVHELEKWAMENGYSVHRLLKSKWCNDGEFSGYIRFNGYGKLYTVWVDNGKFDGARKLNPLSPHLSDIYITVKALHEAMKKGIK